MNKLIFLIIFFTVARSANNDYYYVFAREWPPTSCLSTTCNYMENWTPSTLNIHGLWLNYGPKQSCGYPSNCLTIAFQPSSLSAATNTSLKIHWVGVYSSSQTFHNHEWTKHGTCYEKDITTFTEDIQIEDKLRNIRNERILQLQADEHQQTYFALACSLNEKYNIITSLKNSGIVPSKTIGYNINTIYSDIKTTTSNSLLTCKLIGGNYYLMSYYICLDKSWNIITCPCKLSVQSGSVNCPIDHPIYILPK